MNHTFQTVLLDISEGIATVTLNRPERLNAFTDEVHADLREAMGLIRADKSVRVLILTGSGRGFCAGADLTTRVMAPGDAPRDLGASLEKNYKPFVLGLRALPIPVIGAINGVAAGAGASVALACDIIVAARSASFIQAFCRIGLVPDAGGTYFLTRVLGTQRAMGLALFGDKLSAEQAEAWGLIWKCVDDAELVPTVRKLALQLASGPTQGYRRIKQAIYAAELQALEQQMDLERDLQRELGHTSDFREGVSAFIEKRPARFRGE